MVSPTLSYRSVRLAYAQAQKCGAQVMVPKGAAKLACAGPLYAVEDGGKDIYAVRTDSGVTFLTLVECKHFAPDHKVGVELVRSLYGVVKEEKASAWILATTSSFTSGAQKFQREVEFRIGLQDFVGLQKLLKEVTQN